MFLSLHVTNPFVFDTSRLHIPTPSFSSFKVWSSKFLHMNFEEFAPEELPKPNGKVVFQAPFFRGELLNFGGVYPPQS